MLLARAGLARLGRLEEVTEVLDPLQMLPAPGQGALAVECRADDDLVDALAALDDRGTRAAVEAERAVLATLEGGCAAPSAPWPRSWRARTARSSGSRDRAVHATEGCRCGCPPPATRTTQPGVGTRLAEGDCSRTVRAISRMQDPKSTQW